MVQNDFAERATAIAINGSACCQDEDLLNEKSVLTERIDAIFARQRCRHGVFHFCFPIILRRTGNDADAAKTGSGLGPSDHAGVFASLRVRACQH